MRFVNRRTVLLSITSFLLLAVFLYDITHTFSLSNVLADASNQPSIQISPVSATSSTISLTFPQAIPSGNIIDIEVYDMNNQRSWQSSTTNGGTTYTATTSNLANGNYRVAVGLFTPNWASSYAWFNDLATLMIGQMSTSPITLTPSAQVTSTIAPCVALTPTPTTTQTSSQVQANFSSNNTSNLSVENVAMSAYANWKSKYVVMLDANTARVIRPENNNDTVSEGIGYGMLLSVYANDQTTFSSLWNYAQKYLDSKGLMQWNIDKNGSVIGTGAATDADEDMAYALILASQQWSGKGYDVGAKNLISAIERSEIGSNNLVLPGDNWGNTSIVNPSYIAPAYYPIFAQFTGNNHWQQIETANMTWLSNAANSSTGLVPDWLQNNFATASVSWDTYPNGFYYDAIRTPIRLLLAYKLQNNSLAKTILEKESSFFSSIGISHLQAGYSLSGQPLTNYVDTTFKSGYAAASGIEPTSSFAHDAVNMLTADNPTGYFGTSLRTLTLFILAK